MNSIDTICSLLDIAYGHPANKPSYNPLDELILTVLSQNTSVANYTRAFSNLKEKYPAWEDVRRARLQDIESAIKSGGLAHIKAPRIKRLLEEIYQTRGELSLDFLTGMSDEDARDYLMQFAGVGLKTASCVLMFSMRRPVLPVDTHVHRISQRLGLIGTSVSHDAAHGILQSMVPDSLVYPFHVNMVAHGRQVCKARSPLCDVCVLLELCPSASKISVFGE